MTDNLHVYRALPTADLLELRRAIVLDLEEARTPADRIACAAWRATMDVVLAERQVPRSAVAAAMERRPRSLRVVPPPRTVRQVAPRARPPGPRRRVVYDGVEFEVTFDGVVDREDGGR